MKRPAPPGRKGSVKVNAFKNDAALADEISSTVDPVVASTNPHSESANSQSETVSVVNHAAERSTREQEAKVQQEEARIAKELDCKLAEERTAREQELLAQKEEERALKELQEKQQSKEREQHAEAARQQELLAKQEEAAQAAKEEELRKKEQLREREQRKQESAEQKRIEEEAENELARQREAETADKKRAEEQTREQRRRELEEQRRIAAEEEAEKVRRQEEEEEQELLRLREAEIARRKALKEQREQEAEEERQREQAQVDAENALVEAERRRLVEEAQRNAQAALQNETAEMAAKRERAEAQRRKRAMFLNDMDSFSSTFEQKTAEAEEARRETTQQQDAILIEQMKSKSGQFVAAKSTRAEEPEEQEVVAPLHRPAAVEAESDKEEEVAAVPASDAYKHKDSDKNKETLSTLTNSLFATNLNTEAAATTASTSENTAATATSTTEVVEEEVFRMPTRIGSGVVKPSKKATAAATVADNKPIQRLGEDPRLAAMMASVTASTAAAAESTARGGKKPQSPSPGQQQQQRTSSGMRDSANEDDEEEGTGDLASISNILTKEERRGMSSAQKANWRAKQADLTTRRKDFHGVVTYTFDGIFSWQMYGSAEALDENGSPYTEYLMRCQWGTTFENLQPWIVAHRYKEFAQLDQKLKKQFPQHEANMPSLPKKDLFRYLDSTVIAQRRGILEDYMSKIIVSMPTILRCELMNEFLTITERIATIRLKLNLDNRATGQGVCSGASNLNDTSRMEDMLSPALPGLNAPYLPYGSENELFMPVDATLPQPPGATTVGKSSLKSPTASSASAAFGVPAKGSGKSAKFSDDIDDGGNSSNNINSSSNNDDDPFGVGNVSSVPVGQKKKFHTSAVEPEEDTTRLIMYHSSDSAEAAKERLNSPSLDEDALGRLEEDIRALGLQIRGDSAKTVLPKDSKFRVLLLSVANRWPNLRATAVVGMGVDFTLIPRAMQAEEDLIHIMNEFRGMEAAARV